jgi:hypothetical protein
MPPSDLDMRHTERDILFRLLRAERANDFKSLIAELEVKMEQEDVKIAYQKLNELYGESK